MRNVETRRDSASERRYRRGEASAVLPAVVRLAEAGQTSRAVAAWAQGRAAGAPDNRAAAVVLRDAVARVDPRARAAAPRLGTGQPLSPALRSALEARFRELGIAVDFGAVRIHTGPLGDAVCRAHGARAVTLGNDIAFRAGAFKPGTREGLELVAHELMHVVQLARGPVSVPGGVSSPGDAVEVEARSVAADIVTETTAPEPLQSPELDSAAVTPNAPVLRDQATEATAAPGDVVAGWVIYETEARSGGTPAWRNNNPGNIVHGAFADTHGAFAGKRNRQFAIFPTREAGAAAIRALLRGTYAARSIEDTISRYAPSTDHNDPAAYTRFIQRVTGLEPSRLISSLSDEELESVALAIERMEGWRASLSVQRSDERLPEGARSGAAAGGQGPALRDCDPAAGLDGGLCHDASAPGGVADQHSAAPQPTPAARPAGPAAYQAATVAEIRRLGALIRDAARRFGVPPGAIAGSIADEYDVYSATDQAQDAVIGAFFEPQFDLDRAINGLTGGSRLTNAFRHDLGHGNINLGTATRMVEEGRLSVPGSPRGSVRYTEIVRSLLSDRGTVEAAAATIQEGRDRFEAAAPGALGRLPDPVREAVLMEYYKQGERYLARFVANRASAPNHLPAPGDDGTQYLANRSRILTALGLEGGVGAASPAGANDRPAAGQTIAGATLESVAAEAPVRGPSAPRDDVAVFERAFGVTLSDVRVHSGGPGVTAALSALGAQAAARRDDVYFAAAQPGRAEVGHELAHVVQLRGGSPGAPHRAGSDAELEAEANAAAAIAIRGGSAPIRLTADAGRTLRLTGNVLQSAIMRDRPGDAGGVPAGRDTGARIRPGSSEILEGQGDWWRLRNARGQEGWVRRVGYDGRQIIVEGDPTAVAALPHGPVQAEQPAAVAVPVPDGAQQSAPVSVPGGAQQSAPVSVPGGAQQSAPVSVPGGTQQSAPVSVPGGTQQSAPVSVPGGAQQSAADAAPRRASDAELAAAVVQAQGRPSSSLIMTSEARGRLVGQVALRQAAPPFAGTAPTDATAAAWLAAITTARGHMDGYEREVRSGTFLGATVVGHSGFLARLQLAEQYLQGRHAGVTGAALRVAVGIDALPRTTRGWNLRTGTDPHAVGSAIDLNYSTNPYVRGDTEAPRGNEAYRTLATHALEFSGEATGRTLPAYHTPTQGAAWDELHRIDAAIERYFSMLSATPRGSGDSGGQVRASSLDPANREQATSNVRAFLTSRGQAPADADVARWVERILSDFRQQRAGGAQSNWSTSGGSVRDDVGVLNLQRDVVVALCDVGGLRWGATGFSEATDGDIMHFDASEVLTLGNHPVSVHLRGLARNPYVTQGAVEAWRRQPTR